jgi:mRNA interferase RelE/StbE
MSDYTITFSRTARKELEAISAALVRRIFPKIEMLAREPRPAGCRKLVGEDDVWRIRVGDYRVIYSINDEKKMLDVVAVRHRSKAYE